MEIPEDILKIYWNHLKTCDYPNITKMDEYDVRTVFCKDNRIQFLHWALIKLIPKYESRLETSKRNKKYETTIADLICNNGFCNTSEKMNFIKATMKTEKEILIFNRIFKVLSSLYTNVDRENLTPEVAGMKYLLQHLSKEHFEQRILCNDKIFEDEVKRMTDEEKSLKFKELKKTIAQLDLEIKEAEIEKSQLQASFDNTEASSSSLNLASSVNVTTEEIEQLINKLKDATSIFNKDLPEYAVHCPNIPDSNATTDSNLGPILEKTSDNLDSVLKVLKNQDYLIKRTDIEPIEEGEGSTDDDCTNFIVDNYVISQEILDEADLYFESST